MKSDLVPRLEDYPDPNNNARQPDKYGLRPRARRGAGAPGPAARAPPLSKYRRRTANARERTRMREINGAFEALRRCVPGGAGPATAPERLTKISTLRLATQYIQALAEALANSENNVDLDDNYEPSLTSSLSLSPDLAHFGSAISDFADSSLSPDFDEPLSPFDPFLADFS